MRRRTLPLRAVALLALLNLATRVEAASILYGTTDLGTGYSLRTNPDGSDYGVANAGGTTTYAFDKSPVTPLDVQSYYPNGDAQVLTMQSGAYQVGFYISNGGFVPTFSGTNSGWFIKSGTNTGTLGPNGYYYSPVSDINRQGQVVGTSLSDFHAGTYAAFSDVNLQSHPVMADAAIGDNLNNYIATIPGVSLTSAVSIDDLGRIIAEGSNGHEYLLTPVSLGGVETVPEPTTLATLALGGLLWMAHASRRKYRRV